MKFGQAMSIFEAALPEELAAPYRAALTRLQEAAPALPVSSVHKVLAEQLGEHWRDRFHSFDDRPAASLPFPADDRDRDRDRVASRAPLQTQRVRRHDGADEP